jgi:hypothetical protein
LPRIIHEWLAQQINGQLHGNYMFKKEDLNDLKDFSAQADSSNSQTP